jgi:hypothetical protein
MVRGLSQRPNLTKGPAATRDFQRSSKEEEEEDNSCQSEKRIFRKFVFFRNTIEMQIKQDLAQLGTRGIRKFVGPVTVAVQGAML